jgi:Arc/MetJ-type ribon-helix-helix transcriptional regulator
VFASAFTSRSSAVTYEPSSATATADAASASLGHRCRMICCMPTEKLTVTVQMASVRKLDRWVREGRYANRSQATQAALDLLERRNALPTLEWALAHPNPLTEAERKLWESERGAIDAALDALEPPPAED